MRVLLFGSNGLVGSNLKKKLENKKYDCLFSTRDTNDLFNPELTKRNIKEFNPDVIINCAAKVGGILANDTYRTAFLLENLKINMNILESIIDLDELNQMAIEEKNQIIMNEIIENLKNLKKKAKINETKCFL